jgi:chitinase
VPVFRPTFIVTVVFAVSVRAFAAPPQPVPPVIAGYVFPQNGPLQSGQIDPHGMTRVNYAFGAILKGRAVLPTPGDSANLRQLTDLRKQNQSLAILLSVGGWLGSAAFSDVALTAQSRAVFIESAMQILKTYDLDGLDVDWEYPGLPGAGNRFRAEDKQNFTLLLKELRERFTRESSQTHNHLLLTIAAGAFDDYISHTEMAQVQRYVDQVNLMTYDYYEAGSDPITGNHAPLFTDPADPKKDSTDATVQAFEAAGVPAAKLVLGVPFYGRMWQQVANTNHGLFQPGKPIPNGYAPYSAIKETMLGHGFTRYWDAKSNVPYLYSEEKQIFISYEDPESLEAKGKYVLTHKLGGIMFWSYFNDSSGELLGAIDQTLQTAHATQAIQK